MANLNRVFLIGYLTRDPDVKRVQGGKSVANLRMAINQSFKGKNGQKKEVCFVNVIAWERQAEVCEEYLKKGSSILVEGKLQNRVWMTGEGYKKSTLDVVATVIHFLNGKEDKIDEDQFEEKVNLEEMSTAEKN